MIDAAELGGGFGDKRLIRQAAMTYTSFAITHGADRKMAREAVDSAWDDLSKP